MLNFQMYQRVKVLFGEGSVKQLGELVTSMGSKKVFLVCDKGVIQAGIVDRVADSLQASGLEYVIFDKVLPNPPASVVEEGGEICRKEGCDCVVAVGGGSSMDTGKGVNLLRFNDGPILRFADFSQPMNLSPGLITIPTTSGTGSEVSDGIVLSDEHNVKYPLLATNAMSDYAIIDPELMVGMPPKLTAATGIDTLTHCVESFTSSLENPMVDFFVEPGMEKVVTYLPRAIADGKDLEARSQMAIACTIGGWMLGYGHTHAGHSFGHVIGAYFEVPHGCACAFAEPYVLEFNAKAKPEKTKRAAEILGAVFTGDETTEEIGAKARDAFIHFRDEVIHLTPAKEFHYDESKFEEMAAAIENELFQVFNPVKMTAADALEILKKIYA
ncbi:iron-containing alcohol dehydrogenase [Cuneatibacter sp. NSJ-177]|uniref:iron-containing alcohol dehydrogenase n=1 Tax=Cuneatibacter sp. NSJ-177 TaxID=2931401 RepID=UPI001FD59E5D|nr:iron-containing alcohol dehydrogenase [Cuneatibacter sp. NSJ-177]MCJ7836324.1 iron-containing alcohol dehydrogenase [Cuneatibacter sp. NSJ-177]